MRRLELQRAPAGSTVTALRHLLADPVPSAAVSSTSPRPHAQVARRLTPAARSRNQKESTLTADAVDRDTQTSGSATADRKGPLSPFLPGVRNANAILRQTGSDTAEQSAEPSSRPPTERFRERAYGQGYRNQRGYVRKDSGSGTQPRKPKRKRHPRPHHGRNDATPHKTPLIPTSHCRCGKPVVFTNETRCEDCYANDQGVWHGQSMNLLLYKDC